MSKLYVVDAETIETLREVSNLLSNVLTVIEGDEPVEEWKIAPLEPDGAYRPGWLVALNDEVRKFKPDGYVNASGNFEWTPVNLIQSILWWPIRAGRELTAEQVAEYDRAQTEGWGLWMQAAASRWPIIAWPREGEDRTKPAGELRFAVLAPPPGAVGALPTEDELRACIESHYRASGYLPAE